MDPLHDSNAIVADSAQTGQPSGTHKRTYQACVSNFPVPARGLGSMAQFSLLPEPANSKAK